MLGDKIDVIKIDGGYEALYINNKLVDEGNPLNEGKERVLYFDDLCLRYNVLIRFIKFGYSSCEEFPLDLRELTDISYEN